MGSFAVFLDRDGTINEDPGYLGDPEKVRIYPNVGKSLFNLKNKLNLKLIVISNQSGIARGLITKENVDEVNLQINKILMKDNVSIDAFYYCPFHPDYNTTEEANCRKPFPKLVLEATNDFKIDLRKSFFVGDSVSDIECGMNAGVKTILVKTGYGKESISILQKQNKFPSFVAENLVEACNFIYKDFTGEN